MKARWNPLTAQFNPSGKTYPAAPKATRRERTLFALLGAGLSLLFALGTNAGESEVPGHDKNEVTPPALKP
ncbi:MAG: hypothetical protein L6Q57_09325 [Alphaproteobacteria bacterium]|nr:hypothetical protein [Alphaproteobacteria bacterium]